MLIKNKKSALYDFLRSYPFTGSLVSPEGNPSEKLIRIIQEFGIELNWITWEEVNCVLQNAFMKGTEGSFRYQLARISQDDLTKSQNQDFYQWLCPVPPKLKKYDHIFLMGSLLDIVTKRLSYFITCNKDMKIKYNNIWFLGSERPLTDEEKSDLEEIKRYGSISEKLKTEADMELSLSTHLLQFYAWNEKISVKNAREFVENFQKGIKSFFVTGKGTIKKFATTEDTVNATVKLAKEQNISFDKKKILVLSSNPFIEFQCLAVWIQMLKMGIKPDTIDGCGRLDQYKNGKFGQKIIGNNLAKTLFMIKQLYEILENS